MTQEGVARRIILYSSCNPHAPQDNVTASQATPMPPAPMPEYLWTQQQFEEMSWHDNHVHALRIVEGAYGSGEFVLDLDYILEWDCSTVGCRFRIIPATLTFLEVTNLRISLDYATPSAALGPFSLHAIERHDEPRERYVAQIWKIVINWPQGEIVFEATGFTQRGNGAPVWSDGQCLRPEVRGHRV